MPVDGALNAPAFTAEVTNTRSPWTMGDDQPRPGSSVTQATLSLADQVTGRAAVSATAVPPGPRNCGQSAAPSTDGAARATKKAMRKSGRVMGGRQCTAGLAIA